MTLAVSIISSKCYLYLFVFNKFVINQLIYKSMAWTTSNQSLASRDVVREVGTANYRYLSH
jgi:hypothetical protein